MSGAFIDKVHPEINVRYNSVNVIVGKQGQGKTVIALEEIIKIALMDTHHLLVYVTKDGNESDRSFLALKSLIEPRLPIITISESSAGWVSVGLVDGLCPVILLLLECCFGFLFIVGFVDGEVFGIR